MKDHRPPPIRRLWTMHAKSYMVFCLEEPALPIDVHTAWALLTRAESYRVAAAI
jgi:hypothetical protein